MQNASLNENSRIVAYVVGTQKNRLSETVLLSTQTHIKLNCLENKRKLTLQNCVPLDLCYARLTIL